MSATPRREVPPIRPLSMQQKLLHQQQIHQSYHVKPIKIRPNSMSLPGFSQPRSHTWSARLLQYGQQALLRVKRFHRIRTRRGLERNWYQVSVAAFLFLFLLIMTKPFSVPTLFSFSHSPRLGPLMAETIQALESLKYMSSTGVIVTLDKEKLHSGVRRSRLYQGTRIRRQIMDTQPDPVVRVVDADCLDEALRLKRKGFKPIESGLFRRTNLHQCLDTEPRRSEFYPLPSQGAVYCPNMVVLRKSSEENNEFLERPEWMSFLAMAPLRNPPLVPNEANQMILGERAAIITKKKIQNIFRIALDNGHDAIVLSAFGCGRLHNPPESTARIFKDVIRTNYMGGIKKGRTFGEIVFAITNYKSLDSDVDESYNYDTFKRVIESPDEPAAEEESET
ncbi:hypothetical protein BGX28_003259 [Mortierella sp. GBA30]|nr:hypothetical protein BGX28_003259 [Mortierella sp. GBA30]